jgi:hypothetical protein
MSSTDTLEQLKEFAGGTDAASTAAIYEGEGTSLSARIRKARRSGNPAYKRNLLEAINLYERVLAGNRRAAIDFSEAMSTSDFAHLFGDILDRQILAKYASQPVQWDMVARRGRVRDFRLVERFTLDGGEAVLTEVKELTEYPAAKLTDNAYTYRVKKYGRRLPLSWETFVNDDLDAFRDLPDRLGNGARRTEEKFAAGLYAGASGPDSTFFTSAHKNLVTANPALSITALQSAFTLLASQVDQDGAPIYIDGVTLVVPPALTVVANNIINASEIWTAAGSGGANSDAGRPDTLRVANWMANRVKVQTNPWLPLISSSANGNTSWYLFADPNVGRPAMEIGFLIGHETPELFQKASNAVRVGGGPAAPEDGDFDSDGVEMKVRHVLGGTQADSKMGVASNGSGS